MDKVHMACCSWSPINLMKIFLLERFSEIEITRTPYQNNLKPKSCRAKKIIDSSMFLCLFALTVSSLNVASSKFKGCLVLL